MDGVNTLMVSGTLERSPSVRFREDESCVCTGTLRVDELGSGETVYTTYVPFEAYLKAGEAMGERQKGDVMLLAGKIFWRKYGIFHASGKLVNSLSGSIASMVRRRRSSAVRQ
jgi:single-stranded DNA-binding protein